MLIIFDLPAKAAVERWALCPALSQQQTVHFAQHKNSQIRKRRNHFYHIRRTNDLIPCVFNKGLKLNKQIKRPDTPRLQKRHLSFPHKQA